MDVVFVYYGVVFVDFFVECEVILEVGVVVILYEYV